MFAAWAREEMMSAELDLNDKRLNKRLVEVLSALGERPTASIPAACGGQAETAAAYRFFDNENASFERILAPHCAQSRERVKAQRVALLVQDTTELDFTRPAQAMEGAGYLDASDRRGVLLHGLQGFTPDGTPLGTLWAKKWTREKPIDETRAQYEDRRKHRPLEEKESVRWIEGLREAREVAHQSPDTQCICLADSEADIFELFAEPRGERPIDWIVRACQDRAVIPDEEETPETPEKTASPPRAAGEEAETPEPEDETASRLRAAVEQEPVLFLKDINVRGRRTKYDLKRSQREQPRENRKAQVEVRAASVVLRSPHRSGGVKLPDVTVNVVQAREPAPPNNDVSVEWLLVTTLPINTPEEVDKILSYYSIRFMIEVFFRVLKSGCRVEERYFEHVDRMMSCAAVYLIVAWRTLMLCRMGRSSPDLDCEALFEPAEWKPVWTVVKRTPLPPRPPKLKELLALIAQLGGYINYPSRKDPPGPQTIWLGLQRMHDLSLAWKTFGPEARPPTNRDPTCV